MQSTDGGATWHPSGTAGMPEGFVGRLDFVTPQDGWVAFWITVAGNVGLWHTTDGGTTWQPSSAINLSNVPHCQAGALSIGEGTRTSPMTGEHGVVLSVTNQGPTAGRLLGYPRVDLMTSQEKTLPFKYTNHSQYVISRPPEPVELPAGGEAWVLVAKHTL